jgi:hypothetical protein
VGLRVGDAHDSRLRSNVTVVLFDQPAVAAVDVRGGGPGSRETGVARCVSGRRAGARGRAWRLHGCIERRPRRYAAILEGPVRAPSAHPASSLSSTRRQQARELKTSVSAEECEVVHIPMSFAMRQ